MSKPAPSCLEIVRFRLVPGMAEEAFLEAAAASADFLQRQTGFRRRVLSKGADGGWTDHVEWESLALAQQAMDRSMREPTLAPFMKAVDPESMMCDHLEIAQHIE
jgi:hypothetical protein